MLFSINISDDPSHGAALLDLGDTHNKGSSQQSQVQIQMEQEQELRALQEREGQIRQLEVKEPWDIFALYYLNAGLLAVYFHIYLIKGCIYITFFPLLYHVPCLICILHVSLLHPILLILLIPYTAPSFILCSCHSCALPLPFCLLVCLLSCIMCELLLIYYCLVIYLDIFSFYSLPVGHYGRQPDLQGPSHNGSRAGRGYRLH